MSDSSDTLRRQIVNAVDLQAVVRTMRALSASNITRYERAVQALADYRETVGQGLGACLRRSAPSGAASGAASSSANARTRDPLRVLVLGSDQGLVGGFNEAVAEHALNKLLRGAGPCHVWSAGERVSDRLADAGVELAGVYALPNAVEGIDAFIARLLLDLAADDGVDAAAHLHIVYNRSCPGVLYEPVDLRLLPLDRAWQQALTAQRWPGRQIPEVVGAADETLRALLHEHLYIALFSACAQSLASENACRLAGMQRADKNIDELLDTLSGRLNSRRQSAIDEELFDEVAGFDALSRQALKSSGRFG